MVSVNLKPQATYPTYPPYHAGLYLEEYFFYEWNRRRVNSLKEYLSIFWTNIYCNNVSDQRNALRDYTTLLDPSGPYFTVCQHDDGPMEDLPEQTIIFSAGGNRTKGKIVPIPLICSPIPKYIIPQSEKKVLASFVGSVTHQVRVDMINAIQDNPNYYVQAGGWSSTVPIQNFQLFLNASAASKFILAPRGYGPSSFRLYEAFQLNAVPVYISDRHYLPWEDELNWNEFCVIIKQDQIPHMTDILQSITNEKYDSMLAKGKEVYSTHFTLQGMVDNIIKRL